MELDTWLLYSSIAFISTITPGPAILLASTHSAAYGLKKALATILGNISALLLMSALSVLGLSAIIFHSAPIFFTVKFAGAAYLMYLGIKLWRYGFAGRKNKDEAAKGVKNPTSLNLYMQGFFVALSNPKAIAFTTALFPQFIVPTQRLLPQFTVLITTFMGLSFICLLAYCTVAQNAKKALSTSKASSYLSKGFGAAFVAAGIALATATHK